MSGIRAIYSLLNLYKTLQETEYEPRFTGEKMNTAEAKGASKI